MPGVRLPPLAPEQGYVEEMPGIELERPVCEDCGWAGEPVSVGEREDDGEPLITREGAEEEGCIIPTAPLMKLRKPGLA